MKKEPRIIKVHPNESVCCPTKYHENWNLHPRVFIDLKDKKRGVCPYCGTIFKVEK